MHKSYCSHTLCPQHSLLHVVGRLQQQGEGKKGKEPSLLMPGSERKPFPNRVMGIGRECINSSPLKIWKSLVNISFPALLTVLQGDIIGAFSKLRASQTLQHQVLAADTYDQLHPPKPPPCNTPKETSEPPLPDSRDLCSAS